MDFTNVTKALTARGFKVSSFETAKEAAEYLNSQIDGETVLGVTEYSVSSKVPAAV